MNLAKNKQLVQLAGCVGDFIRYWGFRRIHGQIWTVLYLVPEPIGPTELADCLEVSKSLVTSALSELVDHGLIRQIYLNDNKKTKHFEAKKDVIPVIQSILMSRELLMVQESKKAAVELQDSLAGDEGCIGSSERVSQVIQWCGLAENYLEMIAAADDLAQVDLGPSNP